MPGYDDCDGDPASGCEIALDTVTDCGACGVPCEVAGGTAACVDGACAVDACDTGLGDCDGDAATGCETDITADVDHCGGCDRPCDFGVNTTAACAASACEFTGCAAGFDDCNAGTDGCELDLASGFTCVCDPGETQPCYEGPVGTAGVGPCTGGTRTCLATGTGWGFCVGQQLPEPELCANGIDEDCTGAADDAPDADGDGWGRCAGDCCDSTAAGCLAPARVNPGAFDFAGNALDDDCNGVIDDPTPSSCAAAASFASVTGDDLARAMDLCQFTTAAPPLDERRWGVIAAELVRADGSTPPPMNVQVGVLAGFGSNVTPRANATMGAISSGTARDAGDPGHVSPNGTGHNDDSSEVSAPTDYLTAHGGALQTAPGCEPGNPVVNDSVQLRLTLRVPTNALGFQFRFKFYSAEYPEWICTEYNDFFLAMLYTGAGGIPADRNISFDASGNPVSVNNAFFTVCQGCADGTSELAGTGYPTDDAGATTWLTTTAPVLPGEEMVIQFHVWDTSDHLWDSLVLLDDFQWLIDPTEVGTTQ
jgi:hypothetical protein